MQNLNLNDQPPVLDWEAHMRAQQQQHEHGPPDQPQQPAQYEGRVLGGAAQREVPQLPPQAFTTSAQLLELVDSEYPSPEKCGKTFKANHSFMLVEKVSVCLRDDKFIQGVMRSYDNYGKTDPTPGPNNMLTQRPAGNIVVKDSIERIYCHAQKLFADVPRGMFIIRGENIAMIGEIVRHIHILWPSPSNR
jgi:U6 snRNA-associated Sm-like protein LSm1